MLECEWTDKASLHHKSLINVDIALVRVCRSLPQSSTIDLMKCSIDTCSLCNAHLLRALNIHIYTARKHRLTMSFHFIVMFLGVAILWCFTTIFSQEAEPMTSSQNKHWGVRKVEPAMLNYEHKRRDVNSVKPKITDKIVSEYTHIFTDRTGPDTIWQDSRTSIFSLTCSTTSQGEFLSMPIGHT